MLFRPTNPKVCLYPLLWCIGIALTFVVCSSELNDLPVTPCPADRWGDQCQHACHCRNNAACDSNGFCKGGCKSGWRALASAGPCVHEKPIRTNLVFNRALALSKRFVSHGEWRRSGSRREVRRSMNIMKYRYAMVQNLTSESNCSNYIITVNFPVPLIVSSINLSFPNNSGITQNSVVKIFHNMFPDYQKTGKMSARSNMTFYEFIFKQKVSFGSSARFTSVLGSQCAAVIPKSFSVLGTPVCPHEKWGQYCDNMCTCSCQGRQCLIYPSECMFSLSLCPNGRWGPNCASKCSKQECRRDHPKCHIIDGSCSECPKATETKYDCVVDVDKQHNLFSNKILPVCWDEEKAIHAGHMKKNKKKNDTKNEKKKPEGLSRTAQAAIAGLIVVLVFILIVMAVCMWYYCPWGGKKSRRDMAPSLDGSQLSLTGDSNEDFQKNGRGKNYYPPRDEEFNPDGIKKKKVSIIAS